MIYFAARIQSARVNEGKNHTGFSLNLAVRNTVLQLALMSDTYAKQSHGSQNFFRFSILPGVLGGSVVAVLWPEVAILASSSDFTVFDTPQAHHS